MHLDVPLMHPCEERAQPHALLFLQITALARLRGLALHFSVLPGDAFSVLTQLRSLRQLDFTDFIHLPACLPELTWLEALNVYKAEGSTEALQPEISATLLPALQQLTRLTHLALDVDILTGVFPTTVVPPLTNLSRQLRSLHLLSQRHSMGPWVEETEWFADLGLTGLRRLSLPAELAMDSLPALQAATQLEFLAVQIDEEFDDPPALPDLCHWAAQHPALQQLVVDVQESEVKQQLAMHSAAIEAAQRRNPALRIQVREGLYWDDDFLASLGFQVMLLGWH